MSVTNIVTQSFGHQSNAMADSFHKASQVTVLGCPIFRCRFYRLPYFPLPIFPKWLPKFPLPILPVAHFSVAHFSVAQISVAHFSVAHFTVNHLEGSQNIKVGHVTPATTLTDQFAYFYLGTLARCRIQNLKSLASVIPEMIKSLRYTGGPKI